MAKRLRTEDKPNGVEKFAEDNENKIEANSAPAAEQQKCSLFAQSVIGMATSSSLYRIHILPCQYSFLISNSNNTMVGNCISQLRLQVAPWLAVVGRGCPTLTAQLKECHTGYKQCGCVSEDSEMDADSTTNQSTVCL